jgi:hypothetical protein
MKMRFGDERMSTYSDPSFFVDSKPAGFEPESICLKNDITNEGLLYYNFSRFYKNSKILEIQFQKIATFSKSPILSFGN